VFARPLIASLPKAELHLHLVGSATVDTVLELARRRPDAGVPTDREQLARFYAFTDFPHFIEVYYAVDRLVREPSDVHALVVGAARDAAASQVRWAEITVTVATHLGAGILAADLRDALEEGRLMAWRDHGVSIGWIQEYELVADLTHADDHELVALARAGIQASFAPTALRDDLLAELDNVPGA
jgi:aminodeoxyfutalosine deaminase